IFFVLLFSCLDCAYATSNKVCAGSTLRVPVGIRRPSGKDINHTVGFALFVFNLLNISFTDYLFGSFTSNSSLILSKPELERKSCATVRTTIVAATATINGKDVELLKAGAIEQ
ncbi:hypothetical protein, partial [Escherichia coli]|uniref:hypothetical protein n=1 Tax=Escherichia coli TaxID=562 RepID=UPI00207BAA77